MTTETPQAPRVPRQPAAPADEPTPRVRHYGMFYGVDPLPEDDGRPLAIVYGNCQAESLRVLLGDAAGSSLRTVRVPPVFELDETDLPHLARLLGRIDVLVAQPVRENYRDLPLGTARVRAGLRAEARTVLIPPLRYAGLYPRHVIVRTGPEGPAGDPPLAPYHDLATTLVAAGEHGPIAATAGGIRAVAEESLAQIRLRERAHGTLVASDLVVPAGADAVHTINHPGNTVLIGLARRIQEALGLPPDAEDPGRTLLRAIQAPLEVEVCAALGLPEGAARTEWRMAGVLVPDTEIRDRHLAWYAERPGLAEHVLAASAATLARLRGV